MVADNVGAAGGRVLGYRVYMGVDVSSQFVRVLDAKDIRTMTSFIADDLQTGQFYRFKVSAYNFNGEGELSEEMTTYACVSPTRMKPLLRVDSTISSITLSWEEPEDDGGCPIESYAIYRNDGEGGAIEIEVNTDNDSNIRNKPTLRQTTVTNFPAEALGKTFFYQIEAFNVVRSSKSFTASYLMAAVAPAPLVGPSDVVLVTDET